MSQRRIVCAVVISEPGTIRFNIMHAILLVLYIQVRPAEDFAFI